MGRGKRSGAGTAFPSGRAPSLLEAVGVEENDSYPFAELLAALAPEAEAIRKAALANQGLTDDDDEGWSGLPTRRLYDALAPIWYNLWDHYHEKRKFASGSLFDDLLWSVADLCELAEREAQSRYRQEELIAPLQADKLLAAYDRFCSAFEDYQRRLLLTAPLGDRSRTSALAETALAADV